jgi:hypothetical protein
MATKTQKTPKLKKNGEPRKERVVSAEHKAAMQQGRIARKADKEAAATAVTNPQFLTAKFWAGQPAELVNGIQKAMKKAAQEAKAAEIATLEAKLAELTADEQG